MQNTNIYVETSTRSAKPVERSYGYVIECNGTTVNGFGKMEGTYNQALLDALIKALKRFVKPARIELWIPNPYIVGMLANQIENWHDNEWKNAKGEEVDPRWKELYGLLEMHEFSVVPGNHEYSSWLKNEMRRGE